MRRVTKGGIVAIAIIILGMQGLTHQASATNLGVSISANPMKVVKNQQTTLTAQGVVAMTKTGDKLSAQSTYFIYVEFWEKGPFGDAFANGCATLANVNTKHTSSTYACFAVVHPSKDLGFSLDKKNVTYYAKVTAKRDSVTQPKSVTTVTSKNSITVKCTNC